MKPPYGPLFVCLALCALVGCGQNAPSGTPARLNSNLTNLAAAKSPQDRFYALRRPAKESFMAGNIEEARTLATELLTVAPTFRGDWNYGNAIHDGNLVLGRIALSEGRTNDAKQFLLNAGASPGSPQLKTFGPNMSLAQDLLLKGEKDTVLQYFELCRSFWQMGQKNLDAWTQDVKAGKMPAFGANLLY